MILLVKRLKGTKRPINKLEDRINVLSAIDCIDYLIVFDEDTPLKIIQILKPDILVKGSFDISEIAGAEFTINNGGIVKHRAYKGFKYNQNNRKIEIIINLFIDLINNQGLIYF